MKTDGKVSDAAFIWRLKRAHVFELAAARWLRSVGFPNAVARALDIRPERKDAPKHADNGDVLLDKFGLFAEVKENTGGHWEHPRDVAEICVTNAKPMQKYNNRSVFPELWVYYNSGGSAWFTFTHDDLLRFGVWREIDDRFYERKTRCVFMPTNIPQFNNDKRYRVDVPEHLRTMPLEFRGL